MLATGNDAAEAGGAVASGADCGRTLEFVFPPHSAFTVAEVEKHVESIPLTVVRRASSSWLNPNVVMLSAAPRHRAAGAGGGVAGRPRISSCRCGIDTCM